MATYPRKSSALVTHILEISKITVSCRKTQQNKCVRKIKNYMKIDTVNMRRMVEKQVAKEGDLLVKIPSKSPLSEPTQW